MRGYISGAGSSILTSHSAIFQRFGATGKLCHFGQLLGERLWHEIEQAVYGIWLAIEEVDVEVDQESVRGVGGDVAVPAWTVLKLQIRYSA